MRTVLVLAALGLLALGLLPTALRAQEAVLVYITNFEFVPRVARVKRQGAVTWVNQDSSEHLIRSDDGMSFTSALLTQGASFTFTFSAAGRFPYHCDVHPEMEGEVVVE